MDPITLTAIMAAFVGLSAGITSMTQVMLFLSLFGGVFLAMVFPIMDNMENIQYQLFFEESKADYTMNVLAGLAQYEQSILDKQNTDIQEASKALKLNKHRARVLAWIKPEIKAQAVKLERKWAPKLKNVRQRLQRRLLVDNVPTFEYLIQSNGFRNQRAREAVIGFRSKIAKAVLAEKAALVEAQANELDTMELLHQPPLFRRGRHPSFQQYLDRQEAKRTLVAGSEGAMDLPDESKMRLAGQY